MEEGDDRFDNMTKEELIELIEFHKCYNYLKQTIAELQSDPTPDNNTLLLILKEELQNMLKTLK